MTIDAILSPLELPSLARRDLRGTACVVFDILRATSTFVTALHHGAAAIVPVSEIAEAVARRRQQPDVRLAGERDGVRIRATPKWDRHLAVHAGADDVAGTGPVGNLSPSSELDFDFGNSPREFTAEKVRGKMIVSTTTNGTRALQACAGAKMILASSFLNLAATAKFLNQSPPEEILLICAGTGDGVALEDALAAGALAGLLDGKYSDATEVASRTFLSAKNDLATVLAGSQNARRLLALPELRADVAFCAQRDIFKLVAALGSDGCLRRLV